METLQIGQQLITSAEILPLLAGYRMLPQLVREVLIDQVIDGISCTSEEAAIAYQQFTQKQLLATEADYQAWLKRYGMTPEQFRALATRELKIEKFKHNTWGPKIESHFLNIKSKLDKVIYSLIRTQDMDIAQELYFRIQEGEQSFAELARSYSQGPEAQTGGLIGPVDLNTPHPVLAKMLAISQPQQLWPPTRLGDWLLIVRLEKKIPAVLDEPMRQRLLHELFEAWIQEKLSQLEPILVEQALPTHVC